MISQVHQGAPLIDGVVQDDCINIFAPGGFKKSRQVMDGIQIIFEMLLSVHVQASVVVYLVVPSIVYQVTAKGHGIEQDGIPG